MRRNLAQGEAAKALGLSSAQFISNIERGLCATPVGMLKQLLEFYREDPQKVINFLIESYSKTFKKMFFTKARIPGSTKNSKTKK